MNDTRIVFMGTPHFGKEILRCLVENGYQVICTVTQPDKPVGRKQILTFSEVKEYAVEKGIEVFQPIKIRQDYQRILDLKPDLIITCAYGQIIPKILLDCPRLGCVNVHASLLPKLRGGAPIQHAIIDGYTQSGVTVMEMAEKMDAGDMIAQVSTEISDQDTYRSLHDRLIDLGCDLLLKTMDSIIHQNYKAIPQKEDEVTFGFNISKEEEHIDLTKNYTEVSNQIRGLIDEPCGYIIVDGKKLKIGEVDCTHEAYTAENGTLVFVGKEIGLVVDNQLMILKQVQPEGKNRMSGKEFRNGGGREYNGKVAC